MSNNWDYEQTAPPLNDTKVDRLADVPTGEIDLLPTLSIDIPDNQIIKNLDNRIDDSIGYWDDPSGHNLRQSRNEAMRFYLGKQNDVRSLYRFQTPYVENQIYIAEQAITAYLTARNPEPEVSPAQDSQQSKIFAKDLEKVLMAHSAKVQLQGMLESAVKNALNKRLGLIYFEFDPNHGKNGEILPIALNPEEVVIDKNARMGENPEFICRMVKMSINEACNRWPDKKKAIFEECGIVRGTSKQMEQILVIREVWLTYYDKQSQPHEALVYYFQNLVLEKARNPHYIYSKTEKNFLDVPTKPFIPLNLDNDGTHWIDNTSAVEQASKVQIILNKRGRQLMEVADKANGILVIDTASGMSKDDVQDLTDDPNQRIVISPPPNKRAQDVIFRLPPPEIPQFLFNDKVDQRQTIHNIMGTPSEFSGSKNGEAEAETLGQAMLKKNQASGRQDLYVRAIDRFMDRYFQYLTQMMVVWYTERHFFVYNGGDGDFDYITMHRDLIEDGMSVNVKSGTSLPFDKHRQEAIVLQLMKMGASISLLDAYKLLHMQNPQQLYDNWAKQQSDPMSLARVGMEETDDAKAYVAYVEIMAGKTPDDPDDCTQEFVLSLRKLMLRDEFMKAPKKRQREFFKYIDKAINSLQLRQTLDEMSQQGIQALSPQNPIQPPMPPMGGPQPGEPNPLAGLAGGMPGAGPGAAPGLPPSPTNPLMGLGSSITPGAAPGPAGAGGPLTNIARGIGLPNEGNPRLQSPENPSVLPPV